LEHVEVGRRGDGRGAKALRAPQLPCVDTDPLSRALQLTRAVHRACLPRRYEATVRPDSGQGVFGERTGPCGRYGTTARGPPADSPHRRHHPKARSGAAWRARTVVGREGPHSLLPHHRDQAAATSELDVAAIVDLHRHARQQDSVSCDAVWAQQRVARAVPAPCGDVQLRRRGEGRGIGRKTRGHATRGRPCRVRRRDHQRHGHDRTHRDGRLVRRADRSH
jgi:hypothetical protein